MELFFSWLNVIIARKDDDMIATKMRCLCAASDHKKVGKNKEKTEKIIIATAFFTIFYLCCRVRIHGTTYPLPYARQILF